MKKFIITLIILLVSTTAYAQRDKGCTKPLNERFSFKDFQGQSFKDLNASQFNNSCIKGSNFYQENNPDADIFPLGMIGVEFVRCNLDNVSIPIGNIADSTSAKRRLKVQNDLEDWTVTKQGQDWVADEPIRRDEFLLHGLSIEPKDIPRTKLSEPIIEKTKREQP